uniref:Neprosin PEP catalytic domain-containing protein n=1 Tax=Noccaea caerulescens TaxID=107243 RepID=A0A1J3CT38_NOCCA
MMGMAGFVEALMMIVFIISPCVYGKGSSNHQEIDVQKLLKRFNKPALKSIKSEDGDIIDCVLITNQPAFDHPLLKNHTIQLRPSFIPKVDSMYTKKKAKAMNQVWNKNGECPRNTVPVRRTKKEDILRASAESFGKRTHRSIPPEYISPSIGHEYAIMDLRNGKFFGTEFVMNIWNPNVQAFGEFSLAQTWLVSGEGPNLNSIEAGWQVSQQIYGDTNTRLFVFWTSNGYQGKLCYNLACPDHGFVQTSNVFTVGGSLNPVSQYDGDQTEISMLIWKDGENWWLKIGEENVGYWPGNLFNSLGNGATTVQWGGEIVNLKTDGKHTTTDMGSGHFADEGYKTASYFRNIRVVDETNTLREPQGPRPFAPNGDCYSIKVGDGGTSWGSHFFFGGPGQNERCP